MSENDISIIAVERKPRKCINCKGNVVPILYGEPSPIGMEFIDYNFTGQPTQRKVVYRNNDKQITNTEQYSYSYDHAGRLVTTTHKLNSNTAVVLANNEYDEQGRLKQIKTNGQANLTTDYTYNIRSWTKTITNPLFSQTLYYNDELNYDDAFGGNTPQYNGNISAMISGDERYVFKYDNLSQLVKAGYIPYRLGTLRNHDFSTNYSYDKHGNILSLSRYGRTSDMWVQRFGEIDNLTIDYIGNQRRSVVEQAENDPIMSTSYDFKDYSEGSGLHYKYNANGSMSEDPYKKTAMVYDLFSGMPKTTSINNMMTKGLNVYSYTASGQKLQVKYHWDPNSIAHPISGTSFTKADIENLSLWKDVQYEGNMICEYWTPKKLLIDNGYYNFTENKYYFYIKDHLGNNRIVADAQGAVVQRNDYYPFGMPFGGNHEEGVQPYKFTGKEFDTMNGMNLYDSHARQQDPTIAGRFTSVDPMAERYYAMSPYVYCMNNPLKYVDPDGMDAYIMTNDGRMVLALRTDDKFDRLYTAKNDGAKDGKINKISGVEGSIKVSDKGLLPQLANDPASTYNGHYGETSNANDAFNVFKFASDNSNVEWGLNGYKTENGDGFLLYTSHKSNRVRPLDGSFNEFYKHFDIHSHPNTKAQGASDGDRVIADDRMQKNRRYSQAYPNLITPSYYVYGKQRKEVYNYTSTNPLVKTIKVNTAQGLQRLILNRNR